DVQILAVHLSERLEAEGGENRWGHIVGRGVEVAGLACSLALRMPYKERYVRQLWPERPVRLARVAVLAEGYTVIGQNEKQGVFHAARGFHLVQEAAEPAVDHHHLSPVQRLHPLQFPVVDPIRGTVVGHGGIPALVAFAVGLDVLLGWIPRLMWVEAVYDQEERLSIFGLLQKVHPSGEEPRGEPVLLG